MKLKLKNTVRYFRVGENIYLRDTETYKDYLFNEIVFDILRILSEEDGCTLELLLEKLAEQYAVDDAETFEADITDFVEGLLGEGLLESEIGEPVERVPSISDQLMEYCAEKHLLYSACLELTYRCNERCIHCYIDDQKYEKEMSLADYRSIIDQLCELGCVYVLLTGGELSLHPDFLDIAEYATEKGLLVNIYTNGYNISDEQLRKMIALRPNSISFSLYAADSKIHDSITGVHGSFDRSLRTAVICKCAGVDTFIKTIALKQNADSLEDLFKLGELYHIPVELAKLVLRSHLETKCLSELRLEKSEDYTKLFWLEAKYKKPLLCAKTRAEDEPLCSAGLYTLSVNPYGEVFPCNGLNISIGNIHEKKLTEIWKDCEAIVRQRLPKGFLSAAHCGSCENKQYCDTCPANVIGKDGNLDWDDGICKITEGGILFLKQWQLAAEQAQDTQAKAK